MYTIIISTLKEKETEGQRVDMPAGLPCVKQLNMDMMPFKI